MVDELVFILKYRKLFLKYIKNKTKVFPEEYFQKITNLKGDKYFVFRFDLEHGIGALIPLSLQCCEYAADRGFIPIIDYECMSNLLGQVGKDNRWDVLFEQQDIHEIMENHTCYVGGISTYYRTDEIMNRIFIVPNLWSGYRDLDEFDEWREYFQNIRKYIDKWIKVNESILDSCNALAEDMGIGGKDKILGVILREEFSVNRDRLSKDDPLHKHPYVLSAYECLDIVEKAMKQTNSDKVLISTMFEDTKQLFMDRFGDAAYFINRDRQIFSDWMEKRIMIGYNREYYEPYKDVTKIWKEQKGFRSNDDNIIVDYLKEMLLLSKCNSLIGQRCGMTRVALMLNGGQYSEYKLIPDKKI